MKLDFKIVKSLREGLEKLDLECTCGGGLGREPSLIHEDIDARKVEKLFAVEKKGLMEDVKNYNIEDASSVTVVFESGLVGTIYSACFLSCGEKVGMSIYFKDRVIEYDGGIKIIKPNQEVKISSSVDAGLIEDQVFIEAVKTKDASRIRSTYSDALKTLALTLAADESMITGRVVEIK